MKKKKILSMVLAGILTTGMLAGCGGSGDSGDSSGSKKDYDLYIGEEKGVKVKVFSLGSGTNSDDTLRTEMNSKNKPAIFSCMNSQALVEWVEGGFA